MAVQVEQEIDGLPELRARALALPRAAQAELDEAVQRIAEEEATRIGRAAGGSSAQAARLSGFIRADRGRTPGVTVAGSPGFSGGGTVGQVFFGAEFGGGARATTKQFRPYRSTGYFWFPTLRADEERIARRYEQALAQIEREWAT